MNWDYDLEIYRPGLNTSNTDVEQILGGVKSLGIKATAFDDGSKRYVVAEPKDDLEAERLLAWNYANGWRDQFCDHLTEISHPKYKRSVRSRAKGAQTSAPEASNEKPTKSGLGSTVIAAAAAAAAAAVAAVAVPVLTTMIKNQLAPNSEIANEVMSETKK